MQDVRVRIALTVVTLLALLGGGASLLAARRPAPPPIVISQPLPAGVSPATPSSITAETGPAPAPPAPDPKYYVHVAGAVRNPSLYLLPAGSRVMQAIKAAGGPTSKADLDAVNLAEKVRDGEKIYVPNKTAVTQTAMIAAPGNSLGHANVDPAPSSSEPAQPPATAPAKITKAIKGSSPGKAAKLSSPSQGQVNINTATADQLQRLPGIGPAMAARVLAYRQQAGGFQKIDELQEITPRLSGKEIESVSMRVVLSHEAAVRFVAFAGSIGV